MVKTATQLAALVVRIVCLCIQTCLRAILLVTWHKPRLDAGRSFFVSSYIPSVSYLSLYIPMPRAIVDSCCKTGAWCRGFDPAQGQT